MSSSIIDLKTYFSNTPAPSKEKHEDAQYMEDLIINNEVKDLYDDAFNEHVEPTNNEPVELEEHITPIYPYNS